MNNFNTQKTINANAILEGYYLDVKALFLYYFNDLPCVHGIDHINGEKVFNDLKENFSENIQHIYQKQSYHSKKKKCLFDISVIILNQKIVLELEEDYCNILHDNQHMDLVENLIKSMSQFKEKQRKEPLEINIVIQQRNSLELKPMNIKRTKLDLDLFYEDDFKETDMIIQQRLKKKNDKGIVLLHGLPGTGKTSYLRYLVGRIKKRVLFISPSVATNLMNPDFIELLADNPNTVLIIEDAENIIMDRKFNSGSSVSNLLNISDGLLADFLNVQLICTFNSAITMIDNALLRKGRLIARYEFDKLSMEKAQKLSNHFGFNTIINQPMTIAEIANPFDKNESVKRMEITGFRRNEILVN